MAIEVPAKFVKICFVAVGLLVVPFQAWTQQTTDVAASASIEHLTLDRVLANLETRNAERAAALQEFEGTRIYRMQYHGFPSDRDAEMVVNVKFQAPNKKEFTVVSETGSRFVIDRIFKKLLESEEEASRGDNRQDTALSRQNYNFELAGFETSPTGGDYVLNLVPKTKNKFLYRGKIWVDAKDFAVVRIEGEPGKNPSFWIKKTDIAHSYKKVDDFWLPAENHTESFIRMGGKATLSIEYQDYKITKSKPATAAKASRGMSDRHLLGTSGMEPAVLSAHIAIVGSP